MSKRLQVLFPDDELEEVREAARRQGVPVSAWVRGALRNARQRDAPQAAVEGKLRALQTAVGHDFPTADIDEMLADIEKGSFPPA